MNYKRRGPLGRGLSSLFDSESDLKVDDDFLKIKSDDISDKLIDISLIKCGKYQPRREFSEEGIKELSDSIRNDGIISPLIVRKFADYYELIAGERRLRAGMIVGLKTVPVRIVKVDEQSAKRIALIENIQRSDLTVIEEAEAYASLIKEHKCTQSYVAKLVSKSRSHIANSLRLIALPDFVKKGLDEKKLSMGHARAILGSEDIVNLVKQILDRNLSVRETEELVRICKKSKKNSSSYQKLKDNTLNEDYNDEINCICKNIESSINMKVSIREGKIVIDFKNLENLDLIVKKLAN